MSSFIPSQVIISQAFAIAGLVLVAPSTYFFRNYSRVLDYVQLFYVFALTYAVTSSDFSLKLGWGFLTFIPSFLTSYCTAGDYLCTNGYLISAGISWFGAALLMLIIIKIVSCKKAGARYQPFYNFWKGLLRWFMGPLVYYSTLQIISSLQSNKIMDINFIAAAGVCALLVIWMFVELIGYKCVQREEENNWKKWCDFFSHFRMISVVAIAVISLKVNSLAQYFIYGPILIYDIVFLVKYKFTFRVLERIFFILEEAALITVFSLFLFGNQYIYNYNLDLIGIAIAIVLDVIIFIPKLISYCKSDEDEVDPEVNPEKEMRSSPRKRGNSIEPNLAAENSYDNLRNESPSPRRNNAAGKRR
jgi:hypothetical protein